MAKRKNKTGPVRLDNLLSGRLPLPTFGGSVTKSSPIAVVIPTVPANRLLDTAPSLGDAFSISYTREGEALSPADQDHPPLDLDLGYLRRILLEIFSREEYETVSSYHESRIWVDRNPKTEGEVMIKRPSDNATASSAAAGQVRLSDLRLATVIGATALKRELKEPMGSLELPVTSEGALRWKWAIFGLAEQTNHTQRGRLRAVSFAAAALCLFLDLGAKGLREADHDELTRRVLALRDAVDRFAANLDSSTKALERIVAPKSRGLPADPVKEYTALHHHRMGRDPEEIARFLGITPRKDKMGKGSKDWKKKVANHLIRGVEAEEERLPRAADVFARRDDESVRRRAIEAYGGYVVASQPHLGEWPPPLVDVGGDLAAVLLANTGDEVHRAYVQLGSCIENGIDPTPVAKK